MTALLQPLKVEVGQFGVAGQHLATLEATLARGLPEITHPAVCMHDGTLVVVGSGPSLPTMTEEIRTEQQKGRPICAVNGAHDFLCEQGIIPNLFLTVDARDLRHNLKQKNGQTVYLIASRCAPEVFDHLRGHRILLWHSMGKNEEADFLKPRVPFLIGGGSTSGLRAISVGYFAFGFRNFLLFGMDSCNDAQGRKRFDSGRVSINTDVIVGERTFQCNMAMAAQANEFQTATYGWMPDIHLEARGDGLLAAILAERKRVGKHV